MYVLRIAKQKDEKCIELEITYQFIHSCRTCSLFARANIQPFFTCKRAFLPVSNLHTHVVSFAVEKAAKDAVGETVATEEEKRLNFLRVSLSKSGVNDVDR